VDIDQKRAICKYLKRRFPWLRFSQICRIVNCSIERGGFQHLEGDLSTVGLHCIKMLTLENRLRAEGFSAKKYSAGRERTDRVLMGHKKAKELQACRI